MKKVSFLFALLCASALMFAETATMKYTGTTTSNMTDGNNAAVVNLDEALFTVTADKGGNTNMPGLNKAGDFRLYANKDDGNGNIITVAINGGTINSIKIDFKQEGTLTVKAGETVVSGSAGAYTINAESFSMQNTVTGATTQVQINSIEIDYTLKAAKEEIVFAEAVSAGGLKDSTFSITDLTLTTVDPDGKIAIDANDCRFGDATAWTMYRFRMKTGGKSNADIAPTKNYLKLNAASDGNLIIAVRTGSNSDTTRTLVAVQGGEKIFEQIVRESQAVKTMDGETEVSVYPYVTIPVKKGELLLTYPVNAINFYAISFEPAPAPALEPAIFYGADSFITEGAVISPAQWTAVEWNITRNADKTLSFELTWTDDVTGMVPQINLGSGIVAMAVDGKKATYTTTDAYEDGVALSGAYFYLAYAGGVKQIDITYTVGAENEKPATPEKPYMGPVSSARITAYGLDVVKEGDNYKFTYNANIDGTEANLVFYKEGAEVGKVAIDAPQKGANTATVAAASLPAGENLTWAVELKANPVTEFSKLFEGNDLKKCHLAIDNSTESDYFGRMYVANRAGSASGGIYVYNPDFTLAAENTLAGQDRWQSMGRPAVGADGTVYVADWGDGHGGVYVMDPASLIATNFFVGTQASSGLWTNADGVPMGSSTAAVGVYGEGANTVLYAMNEDAATAGEVILYEHGVNVYKIGQADGSVLKTWNVAPTLTFALQDNAAQMFVINANEHGAFFTCSRSKGNNTSGARSLQFYNTKGERTFVALPEGATADLTGSLGGGCAVSQDLSQLAIVDGDGNVLVYSITWTDDTPALTFVEKYISGFAALGSLSFDYAGNLIATAGANYNNNTANHLVAYAVPTMNNVVVVPAKRSLTIGGDNPPVVGHKVWNVAPNNNPESPRDDCNLYVTLERVAGAGDTIVLADGEYIETISFPVNYNVVIKAAEGAHPVIKQSGYFQIHESAEFYGIKFVFVGEEGNGYCMYFYENNNKNLVVKDCEFTGFTKYTISSWENYHVDSCIIDNCFFHDLGQAPIYFKKSTLENNVNSCDYLKVTNTTIANVANINGGAVIDIRNNNNSTDPTVDLIVDHVTVYNFAATSDNNGGVLCYKSPKVLITNSIFAQPEAVEMYATYCYGGDVKNCLTYNFNKGTNGHRSGATQTATITGDPLFKDVANLDFTLADNSPAIGAGIDGCTLGDPRWAPVPPAPETKTVATVEKLWSGEPLGWTAADSRQWTGFGEYVYWESKANHAIVGTKDGVKVDTIIVNDAIDGTAFCVDGAGNFVVEGTFPSTPSHIFLVKHDASAFVDIPVTGLGRTDIATATGDVFSADGGVVFLYGNAVNLLAVAIKNAGAENQEVKVKEIAIPGSNVQNFVVAGDTLVQYVMRRSAGQTGFDKYENGVNLGSIEGMTGYKQTTLGGAMVELGEKMFAMYPVGTTNYSSEFAVVNLTDGGLAVDKADASKTSFCANTTTRANSTNVGVFLNATKIDESSAYIQVGNGSDGTALFKLSVSQAFEVTVSCEEAQGEVTGGGYIAVGGSVTVVATPKPGYEFVAWKKGEETVSTEASYSFTVNDNIALTAIFEAKENVTITLAVNDATLGSITLPEGIVLGENSVVYGTPVTLTAVPVEGATFTGWFKGEELYSTEYEITLNSKESISLTAKFVNVVTLVYELNGGVTNDYGWKTKGEVLLDLQNDLNEALGKSFTWAKMENGVVYYNMNGTWKKETEVAGEVCTITGFVQQTTYNTSNWLKTFITTTKPEKYGWLKDIMVAARTAAGLAAGDDDLVENVYRKEISAFFLNSPADASWPASASFEIMGTVNAFMPIWKHALANPTEVEADFVLNDPYYEGFTFDGWYATADFSGEKITMVGPEVVIPGNKLYAKWIEYIPTIAEVIAMDNSTKTKIKGTVTFVQGSNFWIQDATGGILCYGKDNGLKEGEIAVLSGEKTVYNGSPELNKATVVSKENGTELTPQTIALSAISGYLNKLVYIEGLKMAEYQPHYKNDSIDYYNPIVTDGADSIVLYNMGILESNIPVGSKINIKAVVGIYNTTYQLRGKKEWVVAASTSGRDETIYPARHQEGDFAGYTLENEWLYAVTYDNYSDNVPAPADNARAMVVKDGIMYFPNRSTASLTRVDAATGVMMDPMPITGDHLFQHADSTGEYAACVTLAYNDLKLDNAGNMLTTGCITNGQRFQVYKIDEKTGAATVVIDDRLWDDTLYAKIGLRFDAMGVYGDVDNDATIMACDANSWNAFRWEIKGGQVGKAQLVTLNPSEGVNSLVVKQEGDTLTWSTGNPGTAPQIFPLEGGMFYIDGWSTNPMLFDAGTQDFLIDNIYNSYLLDDFANCPTGLAVVNNVGDTCKMNQGHNGLCEFQVGDDYFIVMAATNTVGNPTSAFALYKYKDAAKSFAEMEPFWFFPQRGMGSLTNGCRTAVPSVVVDQNTATAQIYVYTNNNGYGAYTFHGKIGTSLNDIKANSYDRAQKVLENGIIYIYRNGIKYTVMGAKVQ